MKAGVVQVDVEKALPPHDLLQDGNMVVRFLDQMRPLPRM